MLAQVESDKIASRQREGWIMASEVEEYLDKYDAVERAAERIFFVADEVERFGALLKENAKAALSGFPPDWPTRQTIVDLIAAYDKAKIELDGKWSALSNRVKETIVHKKPSTAGQSRMRIPD